MRQYRLGNGVEVFEWPRDSLSAAVTIGLRGGSRNDPPVSGADQSVFYGLHHALEHVVARSTHRWPSWEALMRVADGTCNYVNAMTDKSSVLLCARTDRQHLGTTIGFLTEMVLRPRITKETVAHEQQRILEEFHEYNDVPLERASLELDRLMFGQDGLSHPVLGTEDTILRFNASSLRQLARTMVGNRLVVSVVGNFDPAKLRPMLERTVGKLRPGTSATDPNLDYRKIRGGVRIQPEDTEQIYCLIGFPVFGLNNPRRNVMTLLRNHFSSRTSSRIKVALNSIGMGYSTQDYLQHFQDVGQYHFDLVISPAKLLEALSIFSQEIGQLRHQLISRDDLDLAVTNIRIATKARFDDSLEAANFTAEYIINGGQFLPLRKYFADLRHVTRHHIRLVARDIFTQSRLCVVAHGPVEQFTKRQIRHALSWKKS